MEQTDELATLRAENARLRVALKPFADIGIGTNPDYRPEIRLCREAIIAARAAIAQTEAGK